MSQVVLSFALPLPMIALLIFTRRADIMGRFANGPRLQTAAILAMVAILLFNALLVMQMLGVAS